MFRVTLSFPKTGSVALIDVSFLLWDEPVTNHILCWFVREAATCIINDPVSDDDC